MVAVTVNGQERKFPRGKNLLAALLDDGVPVPHYCWHPALSVDGNCRLCLVEVEGQPRPAIACNMTCAEGLRIRTEGPLVEDCRRGMMEFLLVNHPLDCPICDRGGECMLQRYSMEYGDGHARTVEERRRFPKPQFDPLIDIERNRCIMCTRCVRFMDEVAGQPRLAVLGRGNRNYIGTFDDGPLADIFSGNIIDICPVGCLTSKPWRFKSRPWELKPVLTTCPLCSAGCPTTAWVRAGVLHRLTPPVRRHLGGYTIDEDTTEFLCNEGRFGAYYINSPDRLRTAFAREDGQGRPAALDRALDLAAEALAEAAAVGPEAVACLAGARLTNETYYLLARLFRGVLGSPHVDWRHAFVAPAAARWAGEAFRAADGDLALLEEGAYEATFVIGGELKSLVPIVALRLKEAARLGRTRLAVLGPRLDGWLSRVAATTAVVAPEALAATLNELGRAPGSDGAGPVAEHLASAAGGLIVLDLEIAGGALNAALVPAALRLLRRLGPSWRFLPIAQGRNVRGAFAAGAQSDRMPGGPADSAAGRQRLSALWGATQELPAAGVTGPDLLRRAARGEIRTLLLHRADELVHHPQRELVERALAATPRVVAIDLFPSWITERAGVVLPGADFFETEGTMASIDGTLQAMSCGFPAPGDAQEDWRLVAELIDRLGGGPRYESAGQVFAELLAFWNPPQRFTIEDLRLPGPGPEAPQRPLSGLRRATRPDFKLQSEERPDLGPVPPVEPPRGDPLRLCWISSIEGRDHLTSRAEGFVELRARPTIELNVEDVERLALQPGDAVRLAAEAPEATLTINPSLPAGVAFGAANLLGLRLEDDVRGLPPISLQRIEAQA